MMARSPLTEIYQRVNTLMDAINALEPDQRLLLIDWLFPEPESESETPKPKRKPRKAGKKSARASGMASAIKEKLEQREPTIGGFADDADMIQPRSAKANDYLENSTCSVCGGDVDANAHRKGSDPNFHEFQGPEQTAGATGGTT